MAFRQINSLISRRSMPIRSIPYGFLRLVTETGAEPSQCIHRILSIFDGKIILVAANLAAPNFERLRVVYVPGLENFRIEDAGCLQFLHVAKLRKIERVLKDRHVGSGFAEQGEQCAKLLGWRRAQRFISQEGKVTAAGKSIQPIVHCLNNGSDPEALVA